MSKGLKTVTSEAPAGAVVIKPPAPVYVATREAPVEVKYSKHPIEYVDKVLSVINVEYFESYDTWWRIAGAIKNSIYPDDDDVGMDLYLKHSARAKSFNEMSCIDKYEQLDGVCGMQFLQSLAWKSNSAAMEELFHVPWTITDDEDETLTVPPLTVPDIDHDKIALRDADFITRIEALPFNEQCLAYDAIEGDIFAADQGHMRLFVREFGASIKVVDAKNDGVVETTRARAVYA